MNSLLYEQGNLTSSHLWGTACEPLRDPVEPGNKVSFETGLNGTAHYVETRPNQRALLTRGDAVAANGTNRCKPEEARKSTVFQGS